MDKKIARQEFPTWAENDFMGRREPAMRRSASAALKEFMAGFLKRNLIAILVIAALALEGWAVALYTEKRVTKEVTETVTSELRAGFQQYLDQQEQERQAASFLTGEASLNAAMDEEADAIARLLYGYRNNSIRDRKTLIWCVLARVDSKAYPGTVEAVINQAQQWMFYSETNPIREDDRQMALEQLREWHEGKYPSGFSDDFVYAEWTATDIALRDTWEKTSKTNYWRAAE